MVLRFPGLWRAPAGVGRGGMSTAPRLLGVSILCLLLVRNSESVSDDGIALFINCSSHVFFATSISLPLLFSLPHGESLKNLVLLLVFLRCVQYPRFLRSREPSTMIPCRSYRTGTPGTRIPAHGPASGARRSTAAWLLCKNSKLIALA